MKGQKLKSKITLVIKILVAVSLIVLLIRSGHLDPKNLWDLMTLPNVLLAIALVGLNTLLAAWRWILLLKARGFQVPLGYGFALYLIGVFFNYALPGAVGGDLVRGYYLVNDYPDRRMDSVLSIFIDRVLGLYSYFILTLGAIALDLEFVMAHAQIRYVAYMALLLFIGMTVFFLVSFSTRLSRLLGLEMLKRKVVLVDRVMTSFQKFGQNKKIIFLSVVVSLAGQLFTMLFFYILAQRTGETDITFKTILFAAPMGFLITAIPIAPAGIGVGQVAFLYLFNTYLQRTTQFGATAITAFQLSMVAWALVGAALYLQRKKPRELQVSQL